MNAEAPPSIKQLLAAAAGRFCPRRQAEERHPAGGRLQQGTAESPYLRPPVEGYTQPPAAPSHPALTAVPPVKAAEPGRGRAASSPAAKRAQPVGRSLDTVRLLPTAPGAAEPSTACTGSSVRTAAALADGGTGHGRGTTRREQQQSEAALSGAVSELDPALMAQLDTADWQVVELLRAASEAAVPWESLQQRSSQVRHPALHSSRWREQQQQQTQRRGSTLSRPGSGDWRQTQRRRQPTSPLARQLAALRRGAEHVQGSSGSTGGSGLGGSGGSGLNDASMQAGQLREPVPQASTPASSLHALGMARTSSISLLVPQELLAEAAAAAAAEAAAAEAAATSAGEATAGGAAAGGAAHAARVATRSAAAAAGSRCGSNSRGTCSHQQRRSTPAELDVRQEDGDCCKKVSNPDDDSAVGQQNAAAAAATEAAAQAAAAALRDHCWHGRYEEARRALREACCDAGSSSSGGAGGSLLEAGDAAGRTPLMLACAVGHGRLVKLLLRKGAALEARDAQGNTPLLLAVMHSQRAVARHLLQCGADASRRNAAGACGADLIAAWAAQGCGGSGGGSDAAAESAVAPVHEHAS